MSGLGVVMCVVISFLAVTTTDVHAKRAANNPTYQSDMMSRPVVSQEGNGRSLLDTGNTPVISSNALYAKVGSGDGFGDFKGSGF